MKKPVPYTSKTCPITFTIRAMGKWGGKHEKQMIKRRAE